MKTRYIIIRGPLASGKSTISRKLAEKLNGAHIAYDRILDEFDLTKDKEEGYISQKSFFRANEIAAERAQKIIEKGKLAIFDGNFYWKSQIDDLIGKLDYSNRVFTLKTDVETCIARDEERGKTHGPDAARVVHKKSTSFTYGIEIDNNSKTADEVVEEILEDIK